MSVWVFVKAVVPRAGVAAPLVVHIIRFRNVQCHSVVPLLVLTVESQKWPHRLPNFQGDQSTLRGFS